MNFLSQLTKWLHPPIRHLFHKTVMWGMALTRLQNKITSINWSHSSTQLILLKESAKEIRVQLQILTAQLNEMLDFIPTVRISVLFPLSKWIKRPPNQNLLCFWTRQLWISNVLIKMQSCASRGWEKEVDRYQNYLSEIL